jgi:hypothetical protein
MQQSDIRVVRAILAAGCLIAASICVGAGHIVGGERIKGHHYGTPRFATEDYFGASKWLFIFGAALFVFACALAILSLLPARRAGE